jgi:hypothetical protein
VLTDGGDEAERPNFKEDSADWPWWPARSPCDDDESVDLRRRNVTPVFPKKPSANLYACQDQVSCI